MNSRRSYAVAMLSALKRIGSKVGGHLWSTLPVMRPNRAGWIEAHSTWKTVDVATAQHADTTIAGLYASPPSADTLVLVIPGLGADAESPYCQELAADLYSQGYASLRLNLAFSPHAPPDFRRDGFTDDLDAILADTRFEHFEDVFLLGFSLGAHAALRACCRHPSPRRVKAVALINGALDLAAIQAHMDSPGQAVYRTFFLDLVRTQYKTFSQEGRCTPYDPMFDDLNRLHEIDRALLKLQGKTTSLEENYQEISAITVLEKLTLPALLLAAPNDPIIPFASVALGQSPKYPTIDFRQLPGGHIYGPRVADIGELPNAPLISEIMHWYEGR